MSQAHTTTNHEEIRHWIEARGGRPSAVEATMSGDDPGILRVDFGPPEDSLKEIEWEDFFAAFDDNDLAFLYQDKTADGKPSRFFKFVSRHGSNGQ
jgi:hypothetical protein